MEMKVTYFALVSLQAGERGWVAAGDLIPEANSWGFLPGYVAEGRLAPVLVSTLSKEEQKFLEEWEEDQEKASKAAAKASVPNTPVEAEPPMDHNLINQVVDSDDKEVDGEEVESYEEFKVDELKAELDSRNIEYPSNAKKADLIELLEADDAADTDE